MNNLSAAVDVFKSLPKEKHDFTPISETISAKSQELEEQKTQMEREKRYQQNIEKIKAKIKSERLSQGLKAKQLAKMAGVTPAVVSISERKLTVSLDKLLKIIAALGKEIKIN